LNFRAVLALPKTACSAQTHKSIKVSVELFGALYMYISGLGYKSDFANSKLLWPHSINAINAEGTEKML
jgi:hypothetical protein